MYYKTNNTEQVVVLHIYLFLLAFILFCMISNTILILVLVVLVVFLSGLLITRFQIIAIHDTHLLKRRPVLKKTTSVAVDAILFQKKGTASMYIIAHNEVLIMENKKEIGRIKFETARLLDEFRNKTSECGYCWLKDR